MLRTEQAPSLQYTNKIRNNRIVANTNTLGKNPSSRYRTAFKFAPYNLMKKNASAFFDINSPFSILNFQFLKSLAFQPQFSILHSQFSILEKRLQELFHPNVAKQNTSLRRKPKLHSTADRTSLESFAFANNSVLCNMQERK